jgi:competence protein ComGC
MNMASAMLKWTGTNLQPNTEMKQHQKNQTEAFTVIEVLIIIVCVLVIVVIIAPRFSRRPVHSTGIRCLNNLKQIGLAFRIWALDNNDKFPMEISVTNGGAMEIANTGTVFPVFQVMSNELSTPKILLCPAEDDPERVAATTFQSSIPQGNPSQFVPFTSDNNVSYFVGLDANLTNLQMVLSGERNLSVDGVPVAQGLLEVTPKSAVTWSKHMHKGAGNIGSADGSVQQVGSANVGKLFSMGASTNRLAIP